MKKLILALALMGITCYTVEAQTRSLTWQQTTANGCKTPVKAKVKTVAHVHHHNSGVTKVKDTYQVCRNQGGYYTCCLYNKTATRKW